MDDVGNVYGITNTSYFKLDGYDGNVVWHKQIPDAYRQTGVNASGLSCISVSPNGTYLVIAGPGGQAAPNGRGYEMVVSKIDTSNGNCTKHFNSYDDSLQRTYSVGGTSYGTDARVYDLIVDNDGICNCVGCFYDNGNQPLGEFSRLVVSLVTDAIIWAGGETNADYVEQWENVDTAGLYIGLEGMDQYNAVQTTGYQTHNWTLMDRASSTRRWSKTFQSNNGNGIRGYGIAITTDGEMFAGYRDDTVGPNDANGNPLGKTGIVHFNSSGVIQSRTPLYVSQSGDIWSKEVQTDGTNIYALFQGQGAGSEWYIVALDIATKTIQWLSLIHI